MMYMQGGASAPRRWRVADAADKKSEPDMLSRVAKLETGLDALAADQHAMRGAFDSFATEVRTALQSISSEIASGQRTPWGTLASWAGVLFVVGAAVVGVVESQVQRNQARLDSLNAQLAARGEWMGRHDQTLSDIRATQASRQAYVRDVPVLAERIRSLEDARALSLEPIRQAVLRVEGGLTTLEMRMDETMRTRFSHDDWHREKALWETRFQAIEAKRAKE